MPTYEYQCEKCGVEFEREQRISDDPIRTCPKCGAKRAKRLISATSFVLKGGGWYSDLYSSSKPGSTPASEGGGESASAEGGGEKKADKPDKPAKPEKKSKGKGKSKGTQAAA
jgi:putative FmdB family regulatory protein